MDQVMNLVIKKRHAAAHMAAIQSYAACSHAKRLQVGAALVKHGAPISIGWNGRPEGDDNNCETEEGSTHYRVRHAEIHMLNKFRRMHETAEGGVVFLTHSPCEECATELLDAKVGGLVFAQAYRSNAGLIKLLDSGMVIYQHLGGMHFVTTQIAEGLVVGLEHPSWTAPELRF